MEWKYVKPLVSMDSIEKFEELVSYHFPEEFKKCIIEYDANNFQWVLTVELQE